MAEFNMIKLVIYHGGSGPELATEIKNGKIDKVFLKYHYSLTFRFITLCILVPAHHFTIQYAALYISSQ